MLVGLGDIQREGSLLEEIRLALLKHIEDQGAGLDGTQKAQQDLHKAAWTMSRMTSALSLVR